MEYNERRAHIREGSVREDFQGGCSSVGSWSPPVRREKGGVVKEQVLPGGGAGALRLEYKALQKCHAV